MTGMVWCEDCAGEGSFIALVDGVRDGKRAGWRQTVPCLTCSGDGEISEERLRWIAEGKRLRDIRKAKRMSPFEAAHAIGVPLRTLMSCEQGRIDPKPLTDAMKEHGWS